VVAALGPSVSVLVVSRRGYGERAAVAAAATVSDHVSDLVAVLDKAGIDRAVLAGVSGGATVALEAALSRPDRVLTAVAHEPAVGSLAPALRALIMGALEHGGGSGLARFLAGERTWARLAPDATAWVEGNVPLIEADAAAFAAYEPRLPTEPSENRFPRVPLVCSIGEHSAPARVAVAERLSARTGAPIVVVAGSAHLAQFDAPIALAEVILNQVLSTQPRRP
jgi:pimeloyl-ACP methyl ester carboxylesterase